MPIKVEFAVIDPTQQNEWMFESAALIYREWALAYDRVVAVNKEVNDGSKDWADFHQSRVARANEDKAKWKRLMDMTTSSY